ncbi:hypothetical protein [Chromobacterium violaceum]|uniref:hypothetical protein n=1 Tax=Chromobacterium violaceum TaxID=536 RepID=UPI001CE08C67|nr:hypothetical protein [Chromobacterium violaceum]
MTAALPAPPVYRYTLRLDGQVIYIGPEPPEPEPGTTCIRMEWVRVPGTEWGGRWAEPEIVFEPNARHGR